LRVGTWIIRSFHVYLVVVVNELEPVASRSEVQGGLFAGAAIGADACDVDALVEAPQERLQLLVLLVLMLSECTQVGNAGMVA